MALNRLRIPFLGIFLGRGRPPYAYNISGRSNSSGFTIKIETGENRNLTFTSKNYDYDYDFKEFDEKSKKLKREFWLTFLILGALVTQTPFFWNYPGNSRFCQTLGFTMMLFSLFFTSAFTCILKSFTAEFREWHACEHKSIELLKLGKEITTDNLKKCPKVSVYCGSSLICMLNQYVLSLWVLLLTKDFLKNAIQNERPEMIEIMPAIFFVFSLMVLLGSTLFILATWVLDLASKYAKITKWLLLPLMFPGAFLPLFVQWRYALKEPSREKLEQTVEDLKRFLAENNLETGQL